MNIKHELVEVTYCVTVDSIVYTRTHVFINGKLSNEFKDTEIASTHRLFTEGTNVFLVEEFNRAGESADEPVMLYLSTDRAYHRTLVEIEVLAGAFVRAGVHIARIRSAFDRNIKH